jgi:hypothetical protein
MKIMKNATNATCLWIMLATLLLIGCRSMKEMSAEGFLNTTARIGEHPTRTLVEHIEIVGVTRDRVYLEHQPALVIMGPRVRVYWTPLAHFPEDIQKELRMGNFNKFKWPGYGKKADNNSMTPYQVIDIEKR